jgi:hypothetical protein
MPPPQGCFVLNHDMPTPSRNYNTTEDLLTFLVDPRYQPFFSRADIRVYIALCFKVGHLHFPSAFMPATFCA